jgi:hypothetical protein
MQIYHKAYFRLRSIRLKYPCGPFSRLLQDCEFSFSTTASRERRLVDDFSGFKVTTESGDISLWGDCFAETAELYTITGHVHLR